MFFYLVKKKAKKLQPSNKDEVEVKIFFMAPKLGKNSAPGFNEDDKGNRAKTYWVARVK